MFLFSSIPGSLIYLKFRDTRSKIILIDEIRQQHSLILAFVTLAERDANLSIQKLIKFLLYMYRYKIRYVEYITDICLKLDDNNNRSIVNHSSYSKSMSLCSLPNSCLKTPLCYRPPLMTSRDGSSFANLWTKLSIWRRLLSIGGSNCQFRSSSFFHLSTPSFWCTSIIACLISLMASSSGLF